MGTSGVYSVLSVFDVFWCVLGVHCGSVLLCASGVVFVCFVCFCVFGLGASACLCMRFVGRMEQQQGQRQKQTHDAFWCVCFFCVCVFCGFVSHERLCVHVYACWCACVRVLCLRAFLGVRSSSSRRATLPFSAKYNA